MEKKSREEGFILIVAMATLLVMLIFLPTLVFITQNETKWSIKQKRSTVAFQMAEAGVDRGQWKLQESDAVWNEVSTGTILAGYNFDTTYASTDSAGAKEGEYRVRLTTSPMPERVLIQSIGRDVTTNETRALEAEYTKSAVGLGGGLIVRGSITFKPHLYVYWGPIIDYSGTVTGEPTEYPRIITKGGLTQDGDATPPNGHDFFSDWPNPAAYNYNSFQEDLGNAPSVDLDAFKVIAKNSRVPPLQKAGGGTAASNPSGSGYFTETVKMLTPAGGTYSFFCSTCVIYVDAGSPGTESVTFKGTNSQIRVRALIMTGDFEPKMLGGDSVPNLTARIPAAAQVEYYKTGAAQAYWTAQGWTNGGTATLNPVRVWGYVYVGGNCTTSGAQDPIVYGTIDIVGNITINNMQAYYDEFCSTGILVANQSPRKIYWREVRPSLFDGIIP